MEKVYMLLLADLVDSTALNTRLGDDAMAELWDRHDALSRELAVIHRGHEVDRTDGFLMLFDNPGHAVEFACDYHRRLGLLPVPMRARMGLHVGQLRLRTNSPELVALGAKAFDVLGIAKAHTARLMALAQGGQTLASAEFAKLVAGGNWHCVSHGHWQLKGIGDPVEICEIGDEFAPMLPPPDGEKAYRVLQKEGQWVGVAQVPRWLPAERDLFVGRSGDLRNLSLGFDEPDARLIVLHGPGGVGKTRLSIRFAWATLGRFAGGTYFCDLTAAQSADGILHAVAHALGVPLGAEPAVQLVNALAGRGRCLVILDNFEQVASHARESLGLWLDATKDVRFLVTSRESLGLPGEITVNLDSLPLEEAAELFEARARATGAVLGGNDADRSTLAKLMSRLDGLPLAIELAAARSRLMSPRQLLARMNERFTVLESRGGRMSRQATMRTVIDASWDAMTKAEQAALAQLSVFEGGFSLAAAEAVLDVGSSGVWAPGLVQALIDKSLLRGSDSGRFSMLSIIQDYADERLHAFPRIAAAATRRHWSFFGTFDEAAATADHCIELQNLVAACRRAAAATQPDAAADCLLPAWAALRRVGPLGVATALANEVTAVASASASAKVIAAWVAAAARLAAGEYALARPMIEEGLRIPQAGLAPALEARLRCTAGELETVAGDHGRALGHLEAALRAAHSSAIPTLQCQVLNALGVLEADRGLLDAARANYDCALALARQAHDLHWQGGVLGNIAVLEYSRGNLKDAASALIDALRMAEASSDLRWEGNARCNLGLIHLEQGEVDEALCQFARASEISRDVGNRSLATMVRCNMGLAHEAAGDLDAACRAHADAVAGAHDAGDSRSEAQFSVYLGSALCRFGRLRESAEVLSRAQLLVSDNGDPLMRALVCISLGELALHADGAAQARAHLDEARRLATEMGVDASSELARRLLSVESFIPD